ncbi:MAG TPA: riboflavin synthase [Myxococcales bacterium]|nr:riboflavin synthase [Myxococcales bacterium]HIN87020.1 riboflavin synthase [Myxococcales bacterium]
MFTGIVEGIGTIAAIESVEKGVRLSIDAPFDLSDCGIGDSIAIDGCCLTATAIDGSVFYVEATAETLACTTMGQLSAGSRVNLERAMCWGGRIDGHLVQGHVDGTGTIQSMNSVGDATELLIAIPAEMTDFLVEKGSIAVDGISLTVNGVNEHGFHVMIIPHTTHSTTLCEKAVGAPVNLETDIIGKYVVKLNRRTSDGSHS